MDESFEADTQYSKRKWKKRGNLYFKRNAQCPRTNSRETSTDVIGCLAITKFFNTGCFIISDPTFSVYKMVIFWALWSEILDSEISLIYILLTTSGF